MMDLELSYYPGCSLHASAEEYDASTRAVCGLLGVGLKELDDWNCCGASSAHSLDHELGVLLPARNLSLAARAGKPLLVPCAACYGRSKAAQAALAEDSELRRAFAALYGTEYAGDVPVRNLPDLLADPETLPRIRERVQRPLTGLKVVCYYGCLLVRPPKITGAVDYEAPQSMDQVVAALGATPLPWSYKTECCGGGLVLGRTDVVLKLIDRLVTKAAEAGAEAIVTACPLCQGNLDTRQDESARTFGRQRRLPVFYVSELAALAMGYPRAGAWWRKHLIDPRPLLQTLGVDG